MESKSIITIGRQFGSGGREIGKKLAQQMNIPFYDKELLSIAAQASGISQQLFENHDEQPTNSLLYSLVMGTYAMGSPPLTYVDMPINHKIFLAQFDVIKKIAQAGACVIVGRCADYILRDNPHCTNVFIHADLQTRIDRAVELYSVPMENAEDVLNKTDKRRANYYNYYSGKKWSHVENYHISLNSSMIGIENCVEIIRLFAEKKEDFIR